jgi:hypothetical protein
MKVHHITEAPRIEPTLGNSRGTVPSGPTLSAPSGTSSLPKSVDIKPGILDLKGNKTFSVVDQDGKVIKRFSGPSAENDANIHRDNLKRQIRAAKPKTIKAPSAGNAIKPGADEIKPDSDKPKSKKTNAFRKFLKFGALGGVISAGLLGQEIIEVGETYAETLDANNNDASHPEVQKVRQYLANVCADAVVQFFTGVASGAIAGSIASRFLAVIPGAGWIAAILAGGFATVVSYAASEAAKGKVFVDSIANWMMRNIDDDLLANLTDDIDNSSEKAKAKDAMKDLILSDPKMMQAFKLAKKTKATKAAV